KELDRLRQDPERILTIDELRAIVESHSALAADCERLQEKFDDLELGVEGANIYMGELAQMLGVERVAKDLSCIGHGIECLLRARDREKERADNLETLIRAWHEADR